MDDKGTLFYDSGHTMDVDLDRFECMIYSR